MHENRAKLGAEMKNSDGKTLKLLGYPWHLFKFPI